MQTTNEWLIYNGDTFLGYGYGRTETDALQGWFSADRAVFNK